MRHLPVSVIVVIIIAVVSCHTKQAPDKAGTALHAGREETSRYQKFDRGKDTYTHNLKFARDRVNVYLTLDSFFDKHYSYLNSNCTYSLFELAFTHHDYSTVKNGYITKGVASEMHHLFIRCNTYLPDILSDRAYYNLIADIRNRRTVKYNESEIFEGKYQPFIIMQQSKDTLYHYQTGKESHFTVIRAIGKAGFTLYTNKIPDTMVASYFKKILNEAYIEYADEVRLADTLPYHQRKADVLLYR